MTDKDNELLSELFQWYGRPAQEAQFQIHGYFRKAESIRAIGEKVFSIQRRQTNLDNQMK